MNFPLTESSEVIELRTNITRIEGALEYANAPLNDRVVGRRWSWFKWVMIRQDEVGHTYEWTDADLSDARLKVFELESDLDEARHKLDVRLALEKMINEAVAAESEKLLAKTFEAIDELFPGARGLAVKYAKEAKKAIKAYNAQIARLQSERGDKLEIIEMAARLGSKVRA